MCRFDPLQIKGLKMKSVLAGISGGVDSAVAAAILKERGYRVEGLYIKTGFPEAMRRTRRPLPTGWGFRFTGWMSHHYSGKMLWIISPESIWRVGLQIHVLCATRG